MTNFPAGQLVLREFTSITDAHRAASELSADAAKAKLDLRLIEVSMTAGGAWLCAWIPTATKPAQQLVATWKLELVDVDETLMNAYLSLAPKPAAATAQVLILESENIADVFRAAKAYALAGASLIELRIKRAGPKAGAYAFLTTDGNSLNVASPLEATSLSLSDDYRRFFF